MIITTDSEFGYTKGAYGAEPASTNRLLPVKTGQQDDGLPKCSQIRYLML